MPKKKSSKHFCQICQRYRPNEKFTGQGQAQSICQDCQQALGLDAHQNLHQIIFQDADMSDVLSNRPSQLLSPQTIDKKSIPYDELDPNIVQLVQALNRYPGVMTIGSCGGHEVITNPSQWQAGTWYVKFKIPSGKFGWYLLEHLAWVINEDYRGSGENVMLLPTAAPPYLNTVGQCLHFVVEGYDATNPDDLATFLDATRKYLTKKR